MTMRFTILGCGSSGGVPRVGQGWGDCDPNNPKNRRRRCSLLVERLSANGKTTVLVDTGPDLREQLLAANITRLDGILYTHDHADHTHGIDDVRPLVIAQGKRIDVYLDEQTSRIMNARFGYCFHTPKGSEYPPIVTEHRISVGTPVTVTGEGGPIEALPILHQHGRNVTALGFRFGGLVYSPDVNGFPAESLPALHNIDVWLLDALRYRRHPSHFSVEESLEWIARCKPKRSVLTNLHSDIDYDKLRASLPAGVAPAYDGMQIEL